VRHFLARLVSGGEDTGSGEVELGVGALLGLLAAPGAFASVLMVDKYSTFLSWYRGHFHQDYYVTSMPDKYMFIALAMAVTGIVAVLKWDKILPDSQDYLNLGPLPIRSRTVLAANSAAIAIAALAVAVDVSAASAVLFPFFVCSAAQTTLAAYVQFVATHAACVMLASLFAFCAVLALLGTLSAVLPRELFRASASWVRCAFIIAFLMLLLSGFTGPASLLSAVGARPPSAVRYLPSLWYLGLYQTMQHRSTQDLAALAQFALPGLAAAIALMAAGYALSYRRRYGAVLEGRRRPADGKLWSLLPRVLDLFAPRASGFPRACHRFAVRALLRNETHRLAIGVALGMGWLVAYRQGVWEAPLAAAYLLILGLRLAFELPAGVPPAWIFRATLDPRRHETLPVARRLVLSFVTPLVLLPALALGWWKSDPATALLHALYLLAVSLCLAELQLAGYRKIPLACPMPGLRENLPVRCIAQFLGFVIFTRAGAALEVWMMAAPLRFLLLPAAMLGAWYGNRRHLRRAREDGELEEGLTFENILVPEVERLDL